MADARPATPHTPTASKRANDGTSTKKYMCGQPNCCKTFTQLAHLRIHERYPVHPRFDSCLDRTRATVLTYAPWVRVTCP
jgi:hypothetical protein